MRSPAVAPGSRRLSLASATGTRPSPRSLGRARAQAAPSAGWSPTIVCVLTYMFVIHSGKLDIGTFAIGAGLVALFLAGRPIRVPPFLIAFAAFLLWAIVTAPMGLDPARSYERWSDYGKFWLIAFLLYNAVSTPRQWRIITVGWLTLFALFPFRGILFNILTGNATQGRYSWNFAFRNPNDYAAIALLVLVFAIVHLRGSGPRWIRYGALAGAVGLPAAILFTGSRAGLLGMSVLGAILLAFSKRRLGIMALALCAVVVSFPFLPENTKARLAGIRYLTSSETVAQADKYGSAAQRSVILSVAMAVAADHPVFGVGIGNYPLANADYARTRAEWEIAQGYRDSHNAYLTLAAETGIVGLALCTLMVLLVVLSLVRERRTELRLRSVTTGTIPGFAPVVMLGGIAGFAIMCATGSYLYLAFPYLYFALAASYRPPMARRI